MVLSNLTPAGRVTTASFLGFAFDALLAFSELPLRRNAPTSRSGSKIALIGTDRGIAGSEGAGLGGSYEVDCSLETFLLDLVAICGLTTPVFSDAPELPRFFFFFLLLLTRSEGTSFSSLGEAFCSIGRAFRRKNQMKYTIPIPIAIGRNQPIPLLIEPSPVEVDEGNGEVNSVWAMIIRYKSKKFKAIFRLYCDLRYAPWSTVR